MKKNIFIDTYLVPAMYRDVNQLFTTHAWEQYSRGYRSRRHLNGKEDTGKQFTSYIYADAPYNAHDFGVAGVMCSKDGHNAQLLSLYAELYCNGDRSRAIEELVARCNLSDKYAETRDQQPTAEEVAEEQRHTDLSRAQDLFVEAIQDKQNSTAQQGVDYLLQRGWTQEEITAAGIGVINTTIKAQVADRLTSKWNDSIGRSNIITLPLHVNGRIDSFQFRRADNETKCKYMCEDGTGNNNKQHVYGYFNYIPGGANVVVEGTLDMLHVAGCGLNALCTQGNPSEDQVNHMCRANVSKYVLLFDNDKSGWEYTHKVSTALLAAHKEVRVAVLPPIGDTYCNDPDEWICKHNKSIAALPAENQPAARHSMVELLLKTITNAVPYDIWCANIAQRMFCEDVLQQDVHTITPDIIEEVAAEVDEGAMDRFVYEDIVQLYAAAQPKHHTRITSMLKPWETALHCDLTTLKDEGVQLSHTTPKATPTATVEGKNDTLPDAQQMMATTYKVLKPQCRTFDEQLHEVEEGTPQGLPSFFAFPGDKDGNGTVTCMQYVQFYPGLTLLCANTGHGKTSILNCVAVWDATRNKILENNKVTLYLSYEIEKAVIIEDMLNVLNDDVFLSADPGYTIRTYFHGKLHGTDLQDHFFDSKTPYKAVNVNVGGATVQKNISHYEHFNETLHTFLTEYLCVGGCLHVAKENFYYEELVEGLRCYLQEIKEHAALAGKEISMICLDYAQLLLSQKFSRQRTEEIKQIVQGLNKLAKDELHVPIVMCAQFNQQVTNPSKISINCIGEGGDFSRYADTVIGFYHLGKLRKTGEKEDAIVADDLHDVGLNVPEKTNKNNDKTTRSLPDTKGVYEGLMFARLLKTRNGAYPKDTLFYWEGKLKKIYPNCNMYVVDPAVARKKGLSFDEALTQGNDDLNTIATWMIQRAGNHEQVAQLVGALSETVKKSQKDDIILRRRIENLPTSAPDKQATPAATPEDASTAEEDVFIQRGDDIINGKVDV